MDAEHLAYNRAHWDEAAEVHRVSYDTAGLVADPDRLDGAVQQDSALLAPYLPNGSVAGLDMIHLQCHIGTDTLSWARLGAHLTGLDLSAESLRVARDLARQAGQDIEYIQSSIADAATALAGRTFDVVYTSVGVLAWLDDLNAWGRLIGGILRPGGIFFIRDAHPMAMTLDYADDAPANELRIAWPYFNTGPLVDDSPADYSSPQLISHARTVEWPHSLSEIFTALLGAGLTIVDFREHQTLPWALLPWLECTDGVFTLPAALRDRCPLSFSLVARR